MIRLRLRLRRQAIQTVLALVGLPLGCLAVVLQLLRRRGDAVEKILVIRLDLLGDVVLSLPAVRSLRAGYPKAELVMLVRPAAHDIALRCPAVDRVLTFDPDLLRPSGALFDTASWLDLARMIAILRRERFDIVVGLFGHWASVFALTSGASRTVGYRQESFPFAYTNGLSGRRYRPPVHEARWCERLVRAAGGGATPVGPDLDARPADVVAARAALARAGWNGRPLVVINAGAAAGDAKRWTPEGWVGLINRVHGVGGAVALVGAAVDQSLATHIATECAVSPMNLAGETTVGALIGLLSLATAVASGDSGPLHLAEALGRPVIAIHGPSDPRISGPRRADSLVIRLNLPCSPCYDASYPAECPLGHHRCMRDLPSSLVASALEPLLPLRQVE
ncbi:MAG: glycosyltransferase family 9 protein [Dehalococcoidia bacterium]